ncbi:MAG: HlyD family secretion protein [Lachnospiraceae bacterium]|nr:HlyD family secretion protein [Lachnospiraceae bacterium]
MEYEIAKFRNENGDVLCNFDGVVKSVGDPDECIVNNEPYIVIGGDGGYTVRSYISELKLPDFSIGDSVTMMSYENGMEYTGKITEISDMPAEDYRNYGYPPQTYYPITISVDNTDGLSQDAWLEVSMDSSKSHSSDALYIEMPFVMSENGNYYVMKDVDGKLQKCYVKTGKIMWGSQIEIKSGVTMEDKLAFPYLKNAVEGTKTVDKSRYDMY